MRTSAVTLQSLAATIVACLRHVRQLSSRNTSSETTENGIMLYGDEIRRMYARGRSCNRRVISQGDSQVGKEKNSRQD